MVWTCQCRYCKAWWCGSVSRCLAQSMHTFRHVIHVDQCRSMYPYQLFVMIWLRAFRPMQNSSWNTATPLYIAHLMVTWAIGSWIFFTVPLSSWCRLFVSCWCCKLSSIFQNLVLSCSSYWALSWMFAIVGDWLTSHTKSKPQQTKPCWLNCNKSLVYIPAGEQPKLLFSGREIWQILLGTKWMWWIPAVLLWGVLTEDVQYPCKSISYPSHYLMFYHPPPLLWFKNVHHTCLNVQIVLATVTINHFPNKT